MIIISCSCFLKCENLLEKYEDEIEEWYFDHQDVNLHNWLCRDQVLQGNQQGTSLITFVWQNMGTLAAF